MATEITDRVWHLDLGRVNAYLVEDGGDLVLFDAGFPWDADDVIAEVTDAGHDVVDVDRAVITHYDLDHVGGLGKLTPDLAVPVVIREPDAGYLTGRKKPGLGGLKGFIQRVSSLLVPVPDLRVERVMDGDSVGSFTAYHTPGHTRGHVSYVSERLGVGILGDVVVADDGDLRPSPWYLGEDTDAIDRSIEKLAARAPSFEVAAPGHGEPLREGGSDELVRLASD